jgi:dTDP-glucose 4,6-dehydratase
MMPTYVVTGGAGFIGSALVRHLIDETDHRVVTFDKLTYAGNLDSLGSALSSPRHRFVQADCCDAEALRKVFAEEDPVGVWHLAAESHVDRSIDGPTDFIQTNLVGSYVLAQEGLRYWRNLADDLASTFRLVHVSTDEVYGSLGEEGLFTEDTRYDPSSPYSATKAGSDHLMRAWHRTYGLPVVVTNCSNNYGPHQFPEKLIPLALQKALSSEVIPVYGDGTNVRDWLFVDDHVRALRLAMDKGEPGRTYNIGGRSEFQNIRLVRLLCSILDEIHPDPAGPYERLITFVPDRPGHDLRYAIDASRAEEELGWEPRESLRSGLEKTVQWYLDNQEWVSRVTSGAYRGERLGGPAGVDDR